MMLYLRFALAFTFILFSIRESCALPPCTGSYRETTWTDCFGSLKIPGGGSYVGEFKNREFFGQGTIIFPDGSKYVGELKNSKPDGQGKWTSNNGAMYVGSWRNGKKNGWGTFTLPNGQSLSGRFEDGKFID